MTVEQLVNDVGKAYKGLATEDRIIKAINEVEGEVASKTHEEFVYIAEATPKRMIVQAPYNDLYLYGVLARLYLIDGEVEKYSLFQAKWQERFQEYLRMLNRTQRMLTKEWGASR